VKACRLVVDAQECPKPLSKLEQGGGERLSPVHGASGTPDADMCDAADAYRPDKSLSKEIKEAYLRDACFEDEEFRQKLRKRSGLWMLRGKVVVPAGDQLRLRVLEACHDSAMSGHVGITKTYDLVARHFYWKSMRKDVKEYVNHCNACQQNKASLKAYAGKLPEGADCHVLSLSSTWRRSSG